MIACIFNVFEGEKIYGRIDMNAVETMGDHVKISLEKVFLCSGKDGYIPTYDPQNGQYGCLSKSENLEYQVKVIVSIQMQLILYTGKYSTPFYFFAPFALIVRERI